MHGLVIALVCVCAQTHSGYGVDHAVGDLILPHVFDHVELSRSLLGDDLVRDLLQFRVKLLKEIFKQQRQELKKQRARRYCVNADSAELCAGFGCSEIKTFSSVRRWELKLLFVVNFTFSKLTLTYI